MEENRKLPLSGELRRKSGKFSLLAAGFSLFTFVCLYDNPDGIAGAVWAFGMYLFLFYGFRLLDQRIKPEGYFWAAACFPCRRG